MMHSKKDFAFKLKPILTLRISGTVNLIYIFTFRILSLNQGFIVWLIFMPFKLAPQSKNWSTLISILRLGHYLLLLK